MPTLPDLAGHRDRAARQSVDAAHADRQGRCRCRDCRRRQADAADLCLALPDARLDRPVLRGRRLSGRIDIRVWSGTQNPHILRTDLALLIERPRSRNRGDPAGGRRLLRPQLRRRRHRRRAAAVARGRPPRARAADARAGARLGAEGHRATDGRQWRAERRRQRRRLRFRHALSVQRRADAGAAADRRGSRRRPPSSRWATAPRSRLTTTTTCAWSAHDMPPIVRASWFRGVSALPNTFAHESYIDELATEAGVDPIEYRLRYLKDHARDRSRQCGGRARRLDSRGRSGRRRTPRATSCAGAALPMRSMSTASFRAMARRGRPGSPMSPSTRRPAMSA